MSAARFSEADLDAISSLVGLDTITSTEVHCGSSSLYLFEQLTALDRCESPCFRQPHSLRASPTICLRKRFQIKRLRGLERYSAGPLICACVVQFGFQGRRQQAAAHAASALLAEHRQVGCRGAGVCPDQLDRAGAEAAGTRRAEARDRARGTHQRMDGVPHEARRCQLSQQTHQSFG